MVGAGGWWRWLVEVVGGGGGWRWWVEWGGVMVTTEKKMGGRGFITVKGCHSVGG